MSKVVEASTSVHPVDKAPMYVGDLTHWLESLPIAEMESVWVSALTSFLMEETNLPKGVLGQFALALTTVRDRMRAEAFTSARPVRQRKRRVHKSHSRSMPEDLVRIIRRIKYGGEITQKGTAELLGVGRSTIDSTISRQSYSYVMPGLSIQKEAA